MARPKQEDLPAIEGDGVAQKRIKELDVLGDKYVDVRDKRMEWTEKEQVAKANLIAKMEELKITVYRYGDHEIDLTKKANVKVKNVDASADAEEEETE